MKCAVKINEDRYHMQVHKYMMSLDKESISHTKDELALASFLLSTGKKFEEVILLNYETNDCVTKVWPPTKPSLVCELYNFERPGKNGAKYIRRISVGEVITSV